MGMYDSHGFMIALLQWHKVHKFSEDELHRAPVVALTLRADGSFIEQTQH